MLNQYKSTKLIETECKDSILHFTPKPKPVTRRPPSRPVRRGAQKKVRPCESDLRPSMVHRKPLLSRRGLGWLSARLFKGRRQLRLCPAFRAPFAARHKKRSDLVSLTLKRRLPTLPRENRSTIGVSELNFSVRNGKRWNLTAIAT